MRTCKRLIIRGFVQGVGYRTFIRMMARKMNIHGKVKNLDDGSVEVIAVGSPEAIDYFIENIRIRAETPFEPDVHEIEVHDYTAPEEYRDFSIDYGYELRVAEKEMLERSEMGIIAFSWMGKHLGKKMDKGFKELGDKMAVSYTHLTLPTKA